MKKIYSFVLALAMSVALVGCGTAEETPEETSGGDTTPEEPTEEVVDVDLPNEIVMGFVPSQDSANIADTVAPLADRLSEELGVDVRGEVMTNYTALVEAMGNDQVHIGFIPAFGYVLATDRYDNIEAVLKSIRHGSSTYKAQYTVRTDSDIQSIEDLEGKVWAFPDLASTSGYLFPAAQLVNEYGVDPDQIDGFFSDLIQAGGHDNALIQVLEGNADVATTFDDARTAIEGDYPEAMEELRVLGYTAEIPNDTISLNTNLPEEFRNLIVEVFLSFNDDEDMLTIMDEVYNWTGIDTASDSDYDVVRETAEVFPDMLN